MGSTSARALHAALQGTGFEDSGMGVSLGRGARCWAEERGVHFVDSLREISPRVFQPHVVAVLHRFHEFRCLPGGGVWVSDPQSD